MKDLELLDLTAQIRHVFGGKSLIWRMKEWAICRKCSKGTEGESNSRSRTDGTSSVDIKVMWMVCARVAPSAWGL